MKTKITLLVLFFAFLLNAQVTYIPMPTGYGYYAQGYYWTEGSAQIAYAEGNYLYGITSKLNAGGTGYDGYIFRHDITNNSTTIYSQTLTTHPTLFPTNFTSYNNRIYFNYYGSLYRINLSNGIINELISGTSNNFWIKNDKIYSFGQGQPLKIFDLASNTITTPQYTDTTTSTTYLYYPKLYAINGNDVYFYGYNIANNGGLWYHKIFKIDGSGNITIVYDLNNTSTPGQLFSEYNSKVSLPIINNKIIFYNPNLGSLGLATFDVSTNTYNSNLYTSSVNNYSYFEVNGWLYFQDTNGIIHKTNGTSVSQAGLPTFYQYGLSGSYQDSPITYFNGLYYGAYNNNVYQSDLTFDNTYSISSSYSMNYSLVANNKLCFISGQNFVSYDGTSFSTIPLGFINVESRINKMIQIGNALYVCGYNYNGTYYNSGIHKIDLSTLSTNSFSTPSSTFSPNPTTSNITFYQEINNLEIFDITGKKVKSFENATTTFDVADLEKGIYFLKGKTVEGTNFNERLVKK